MLSRLRTLWALIRDSLWFLPAMFTLFSVGTAAALVQLEEHYQWKLRDADFWLLGGGAEGARQVLSTIAGSLITVTGVVFSVTIVALQLASSQYTPRLLRNYMANRSTQVVLGVFIATFTYTLLILRVIRSPHEDEAPFVPHVAVGLSIALMLLSIACLIYFIHHSARSIQISNILSRLAAEALAEVRRQFPQEFGEPDEGLGKQEPHDQPPQLIPAVDEGYLIGIDADGLFKAGQEHRLLIQMTAAIGTFFIKGQTLAEVWPDDRLDKEAIEQIQQAFILGEQRTPEQDLQYSLIEIADIAVKALSPGINDPTTALLCIDRLTQVLAALGKRCPPPPVRTEAGRVHFVARYATFEETVQMAFEQIIVFSRDMEVIRRTVRKSLDQLIAVLPAERHVALRRLDARLK